MCSSAVYVNGRRVSVKKEDGILKYSLNYRNSGHGNSINEPRADPSKLITDPFSFSSIDISFDSFKNILSKSTSGTGNIARFYQDIRAEFFGEDWTHQSIECN